MFNFEVDDDSCWRIHVIFFMTVGFGTCITIHEVIFHLFILWFNNDSSSILYCITIPLYLSSYLWRSFEMFYVYLLFHWRLYYQHRKSLCNYSFFLIEKVMLIIYISCGLCEASNSCTIYILPRRKSYAFMFFFLLKNNNSNHKINALTPWVL